MNSIVAMTAFVEVVTRRRLFRCRAQAQHVDDGRQSPCRRSGTDAGRHAAAPDHDGMSARPRRARATCRARRRSSTRSSGSTPRSAPSNSTAARQAQDHRAASGRQRGDRPACRGLHRGLPRDRARDRVHRTYRRPGRGRFRCGDPRRPSGELLDDRASDRRDALPDLRQSRLSGAARRPRRGPTTSAGMTASTGVPRPAAPHGPSPRTVHGSWFRSGVGC